MTKSYVFAKKKKIPTRIIVHRSFCKLSFVCESMVCSVCAATVTRYSYLKEGVSLNYCAGLSFIVSSCLLWCEPFKTAYEQTMV